MNHCLAAKAENLKTNNNDVDDTSSQDISVTDNTTDNLQAQAKELDTSETAAATMGDKASSSFLGKDDSSNPNIIDPLNTLEYQDNFQPLQLSAEAKAIADAANAKNVLRREHLLKVAEKIAGGPLLNKWSRPPQKKQIHLHQIIPWKMMQMKIRHLVSKLMVLLSNNCMSLQLQM